MTISYTKPVGLALGHWEGYAVFRTLRQYKDAFRRSVAANSPVKIKQAGECVFRVGRAFPVKMREETRTIEFQGTDALRSVAKPPEEE
jgi:hypothetical protein